MPYLKDKYRKVIDRTFYEMKGGIYSKVEKLEITAWKTKEPVSFSNRMCGEMVSFKKGDSWGELWDCAWFNFKGSVPGIAKGKKVVLMIDLSGEGCVFDNNGIPVRGITTVESTFDAALGIAGKRIYQFVSDSSGDEVVDIWVDAGCNDLFGNMVKGGVIVDADIAICNDSLRSLFYDFQVLISLMDALDKNSARTNRILFKLYEASNILTNYNEAEVEDARRIIACEINKKGGDPSLRFTAIGHAHIDLAWLWPIRETKRKGVRTFSTAIELMNKNPEYIFGASQPQLYEWIKTGYPELYEKIKEKIKSNQWEAQGAMWVEADTNIISGESLVRQILFGKRYFKEEFNKDIKVLWLPDVFGYSGALPQILKKSGVDYFMTQKLSWNEQNKFPHHTFMWEGIDGSQVLTHMLAENTYNSPLSPKIIHDAELNYLDSGICDEALSLFGIGDGGGGPGPEHLERAKRMQNLEGLPPVKMGLSEEFFKRISKFKDSLKTWEGELYLERHQGTYTTQAKNKLYNRKMELALRELEFAYVLSSNHENYPKEEMERIWKEVLLYQFHDIIPGSSIKRVYDESLAQYQILYDLVNKRIYDCYESIAKNNKGTTVFNSLSWERNEWIVINGENHYVKIPAMGYAVVDDSYDNSKTEENPIKKELENTVIESKNPSLENGNLKVIFNEDGSISSIYDKKSQRETLVSNTKSNVFNLYEDKGDCWDIEITYTDKKPVCFNLENQEFLIDGPNAICRQTYRYNNSVINQDVILSKYSKRVEFKTKVDWKENLLMLRTSFNVAIKAEFASYEIQFGEIKRSTHENTTWDLAQFETCGHKWVDLSQPDYGVALLNDCKYGHRITKNVMDLNLLRAQNYPGINADRGEHEFVYAIYPHSGEESTGNVVRQAYELNVPLYALQGAGKKSTKKSFVFADGNIVIDTIKKAEDSNDIILRLYEPYGMNTKSHLEFDNSYNIIEETDLLETSIRELAKNVSALDIDFKPFEIITLKLSK